MNFCVPLKKVLPSEGQATLHVTNIAIRVCNVFVFFVQHTLTRCRQMHNILSAHIRNTSWRMHMVCLDKDVAYCIFRSKQVITLTPSCRVRLRTIHWQHTSLKETRYYQLFVSRPELFCKNKKKSYKRKPKSRHSKRKASRHQKAYFRSLHIADVKANYLPRHVSATGRMVQYAMAPTTTILFIILCLEFLLRPGDRFQFWLEPKNNTHVRLWKNLTGTWDRALCAALATTVKVADDLHITTEHDRK
jgi:hypothetical protein